MIGKAVTYILLIICSAIFLLSAFALIRGILYRPAPKFLNLYITRRTNSRSEWFTLVLQRPWYLRWLPLPRFRAGQSIAIAPHGHTTKRRYSLARWHKTPFSYEVTIKREPLGKVSNRLWLEAKTGTQLRVTPPSGDFVLAHHLVANNHNAPLVFIAGGVGITPLLAMLDEYLPRADQQIPIHLFWQVRHEHEWIYQPLLLQLQRQYPQLRLHLLVSQPLQPEQNAHRININLLRAKLGKLSDYHYYLCASETLLDTLCSALETNGVTRSQIHFERFSIASSETTGIWTLNVKGRAITFDGHKTLLDALEENNIPISSDCRTGSCGECQLNLNQGTTKNIIQPEFTVGAGKVLACCCIPQSDLLLDV